jgi:hypothetical protein
MKNVDIGKVKQNHLAEIGQHNKTEFALCRYDTKKETLIQCHQFVHCRDFMLDAITGAEENRDMEIYGFKYHKNDPRPDSTNASVLVRLEGSDSLKNFETNLPILKGIEEFMGWATTAVDVVDFPDKKSVVIWALGDANWSKTALTFSLYTYLLKCLTYKIKDQKNWKEEIKKQNTVESRYMDEKYLDFLFANLNTILPLYKNFSGWEKGVETYKLHNSSGFVSLKGVLTNKGNAGIHNTHVCKDFHK